MDIGEKIHRLRIENDMTLEELGSKVGVGKSTVRKWEQGIIKNMKRDKISLIANALNCTPAYLMDWEETTSDDFRDQIIEAYIRNDALQKLSQNERVLSYAEKLLNMDDNTKQLVFDLIDAIEGRDNS